MRRMVIALLIVGVACSKEQTQQKVTKTVHKVANGIEVPWDNKPDDAKAREQQRFDEQFRQLESFRAQQQQLQQQRQQQQQAQQVAAPAWFRFVTGAKETFKNVTPQQMNQAPINVPITGDVKGPSVLRAQVYLDRIHFSIGTIDGRWGRNSAIAVWWYQRARGIDPTGDLDQATYARLAAEAEYAPVVQQYTVTADDLAGPFANIPDDVYEAAKLKCMCYQTVREKIAEKFHVDEDFIETLNPNVKFSDLQAGSTIDVPNVRAWLAADQKDFAKVTISIAGNSFNAWDANNNLVFHAPTTLGSGYDPSPSETLHVVKVTWNPHFHYDPTLYHEVPDSNPDAMLSPGPNSPVGIVWIALSKEHYGIHGNPDPESIGYSSSHGCVRLTNWDANEVAHRISEGTQVSFVDVKETKSMPDIVKK